uniref:Uncharacterized protein n=1 Tax=Daucus carota subsp. sativus TaxID=79200 RepID=A0A162A4V4_DAUCS
MSWLRLKLDKTSLSIVFLSQLLQAAPEPATNLFRKRPCGITSSPKTPEC